MPFVHAGDGAHAGGGLGPGRRFLPGAVRDLVYIEDCRCFRYTSSSTYSL